MFLLKPSSFGSLFLAEFAKLAEDVGYVLDPTYTERNRAIALNKGRIAEINKQLLTIDNPALERELLTEQARLYRNLREINQTAKESVGKVRNTRISLTQNQNQLKKALRERNQLLRQIRSIEAEGKQPSKADRLQLEKLENQLQRSKGNIRTIAGHYSQTPANKGDRLVLRLTQAEMTNRPLYPLDKEPLSNYPIPATSSKTPDSPASVPSTPTPAPTRTTTQPSTVATPPQPPAPKPVEVNAPAPSPPKVPSTPYTENRPRPEYRPRTTQPSPSSNSTRVKPKRGGGKAATIAAGLGLLGAGTGLGILTYNQLFKNKDKDKKRGV